MDWVFRVVSLSNQFVSVAPFLAGAIVALAARTVDSRVRWLVLAGCLLPWVFVIGSRVVRLGYAVDELAEQLLGLASVVLFLIAMAIAFRSDESGTTNGSR